jgi:hypothetical protein
MKHEQSFGLGFLVEGLGFLGGRPEDSSED